MQYLDLRQALASLLLVVARVAPLAWLGPWFGTRGASPITRASLTAALTACVAPLAWTHVSDTPGTSIELTVAAITEFIRGSLFTLVVAIPLFALNWAGRLVDLFRGASLAEVFAPAIAERTSPLGDLYLMMATVLFVVSGGLELSLESLANSFAALPVGDPLPANLLTTVAKSLSHALTIALSWAAPALVAVFMTDLSLGLLARSTPQIPVFFAGMPLKAVVGIAAVLFALSISVSRFPDLFRKSAEQAQPLLEPTR